MARERARPRGPGRARAAFQADTGGQMMLLTAIVLLIGFIALAGMVSRVSLLAQQAGREQDRPLLREVEPLQKGLDAALDPAPGGKGLGAMGLAPGTVAYDAAAQGVLEHLQLLLAERGFIARWTIECGSPLSDSHATLSVSDGELDVRLRSRAFTRPAPCIALSG